MDPQIAPYFGSSLDAPANDKRSSEPEHHDLLTFLAASQRLQVDFLPITSQPKLTDLGRGGTAVVGQSAVDLQTSFAYKRMHTEDSSKNFERLTAEVAALKSNSVLGHPKIGQLEGICWEVKSRTDRVLPVLVFEKAEFGDMRQLLATEDGQNADMDTRIKWCLELAGALHSLHTGDIIHGDIKPGNILVFKNDSGRHIAKLTDFGYATSAGNDVYLPYTWPWAPPEWHPRALGLPQAKKADIYSFGMTCLWILFSNDPSKFADGEIAMPPDETSQRTLVDLMKQGDELPDFARKLINRAAYLNNEKRDRLISFFDSTIRLDPNRRQLDLPEFSKLLELEQAQISPKRNDRQGLACRSASITRFQVAPSFHYFVMAIPEVRITIRKALEEKAKDCKCHLPSESCPEKRNAALQLAFCYELGFGVPRDKQLSASWLTQSAEGPQVLYSIVERVRQEVLAPKFQDGLFKRLWDEGHISKFDFSEYHRGKQTLDEVESHYRREITDMEDVLGENHGAVWTLKSSLSAVLMEEGRLPQAAELDEEVLKGNLSVLGPYSHDTIMTTGHLALIYSHLGKLERAETLHRELLDRCEKVLGSNHPSTIAVMANLGSVLRLRGCSQEAETLDIKMVELQTKVFGPEHPESLSAVLNLAATYRSRNLLEQAAKLEEQMVPIARRVLPDGHPILIRAESNLSLTYDRQGRLKESEDLLRKVFESSERFLGPSHPATMANMHNLASLCRAQGRLKEAEDLLVRAISIQKDRVEPEHPDTLKSMGQLAQTFSEQGRLFEAKDLLSVTLEGMKRSSGDEGPIILATKTMLGGIQIKLGQYDDAETLLQEVIDAETRMRGPDHPSTLTTKQNLAMAYMSNKKYGAAEELFSQVFEAREKALGKDAVPTMIVMASLSSTYRCQERLQEALEMNREVVERMKKVLGDEHPHTLTALGLQANMLIDTKSFADAERLLYPLLEIKKRLLGPEHPETLSSLYAFAQVCLNQGRTREGTEILRRVLESRATILGAEHPDTRSVARLLERSGDERPQPGLSG